MAQKVNANGKMMLIMANSQRSHFSADKGTLNLSFKNITAHDEFQERLHKFMGLFEYQMTELDIKMKVHTDDSVPEEISIEKSKYFEILYHLVMNSVKHKCRKEAKIRILISFEATNDPVLV